MQRFSLYRVHKVHGRTEPRTHGRTEPQQRYYIPTATRCAGIKRAARVGAWTGTLKTLRNVYGVGSPTVGPTSSSVRLHIYVPSHIGLKYR